MLTSREATYLLDIASGDDLNSGSSDSVEFQTLKDYRMLRSIWKSLFRNNLSWKRV